MVFIIDGGCCFGAPVLFHLSTMTFYLSSTTSSTTRSCVRLNDAGMMITMHIRLVSVCAVVARWSKVFFIIFIIFGTFHSVVDDY
jgi:hypothetical protein